MKQIYMTLLASVLCLGANAADGLDVTFTTPGDFEGWTVGNNGTSVVADGHLDVTMGANNDNTVYRADLNWGSNSNESPIDFIEGDNFVAIKFIGSRPHGSLKLVLANNQGENLVEYTYDAPTGEVTTLDSNHIYYFQLDKNANFKLPFAAQRINFKVADSKEPPYIYKVDWIKTFSSLEAIEAAKNVADDGSIESDDVAGQIKNETTGASYDSLTDAWNAAVDGDVIVINKDVTLNGLLVSNSREITVKGNGTAKIIRDANYKGMLFLTMAGKDAEGKTIEGPNKINLENLVIDGAGVETSGQIIEAGNNGTFNLNDVTIQNGVTTHEMGMIAVKGGGAFIANNLEITNCKVPEGYGDVFGGTSNIDLSGKCNFSVFLENTCHINDKGVTEGTVEILFNVGKDKFNRNLDASVVDGTDSKDHFITNVKGYDLKGTDGKLYIAESSSTVAGFVVEPADSIVNVYSLQGMLVRANVPAEEALVGLPAGLYIVNGKKVVK